MLLSDNMEHTTENKSTGNRFFKLKRFRFILIAIAVLIVIRLILPYVILHFANDRLANMSGYYGKIRDIDLAIFRGAYKIKDMYLHKKDTVSGFETEFFDAQVIDLSVHWDALLDGKIVGELEFDAPTLRFTKDKVELQTLEQDTSDFRDLLKDFMPLRVNRFQINHGTIRYRDLTSNPKLDIGLTDAYLKAENLTNVKDEINLLPSTVEFKANVYEGTIVLNMKLDPFNRKPTFDMNTELKNTNLPLLNDFFKAYGKFDVNRGTFGLYAEGAAKDGNFVGYVKPIIKDLDVLGPEDRDDNLLKKFWEGVVGAGGQIFRNRKKDQVATKIPLEGPISKTEANIFKAIVIVLRNAFVEALQPSIDNEISITSVGEVQQPEEKKGILGKIFNKAEKKAEEKDNKNKEEGKQEEKK
jgi:hypothetical protein